MRRYRRAGPLIPQAPAAPPVPPPAPPAPAQTLVVDPTFKLVLKVVVGFMLLFFFASLAIAILQAVGVSGSELHDLSTICVSLFSGGFGAVLGLFAGKRL